ncbi:MAG: UDP-N-acetylmuramoyl-tripeptide--D-alanyl-D-alanine ligase [Roseivirga sp.]|uniref:UDP-N-acetylmuramoyl-tripeptide--D-alanyl-D- alanine ligase n=1 Tax=Roseivirga sp. TaxID=1964215 RepID=UPI001B2CFBA9|nr:UDP-N-acetylmuramoyl-tripeptide--D-alanyl-D-alanine ligase [Roseivirga sp.]MBO6662387.1 UDP-N-acetylmuramoyl-tripeptide--D-alanyl-D-alanine ligase [Roseivirga sp.]MBO6910331.1 UDP-N-acetylmuramoyl-tripeptide--D-alanyl-D-alanine ligase [Roseivirga sp.]
MIEQLYQTFLKSTGVSTDTRTIQDGNIWVALKGPNFNANKFAQQALESGAMAVVVDDPEFANNDQCILVEDGLEALQKLANHHRRQFKIPVLGITGSNGKTTTKELVRDVLAKKFNVLATKGNLNNHIGVPLTLLGLNSDIEFAIIEMGANHQKEIAALSSIAEPEFGLITNIGKAHLEGFGGLEGVFKGKTELYEFISARKGKLFVNSRNERLLKKAHALVDEVYTYPEEGDYFHAKLVSNKPNVKLKSDSGKLTSTNLGGEYNFENMCAALCIGRYFGVEEDDALEAIAAYQSDNNRSQLLKRDSNTIFLDAYNANPTSMSLSLQNFASEEGYKVAILGDMFELGDEAQQEHYAIGELSTTLSIDLVIFCGKLMEAAHRANPDSLYFESKSGLASFLTANKRTDTSYLVKGSRGMSLESLVELL